MPPAAERGALSPSIAFAKVPRVQLDNHLVGLEDEFELLLLRGGVLIELGAEALGALALAFGFAIQSGGRQLHASKVFEHDAGAITVSTWLMRRK